MFLRLKKQFRLMIGFLAGLCVTLLWSSIGSFAQPAQAIGSHPLKAPTGYAQPDWATAKSDYALETAATHQAPNFY
jgi:hypothetical protein